MNETPQNTQTPCSTMSSEAQRIAIAEACGWHDVKIRGGWCYGYRTPDQDEEGKDVPDYLSDLNAMHEAEKVANLVGSTEYFVNLCKTAGAFPSHATATQRAEAFLKTLNLWDENQ